jgi:flavin reductase (DIM6/NTAB) family NADH-FMN oxidoreductase RutF
MREEIAAKQFIARANDIWDSGWFLLTCGDFRKKHFNCMTVSWGGFGTMWDLPIAMIVVRPTRYTLEFLDRYDNFTLCAFPEVHRKDLSFLGSRSGRDGDKIGQSGLTPCAASCVSSPIYQEAELAIECHKLYEQDFNPGHFMDDRIMEHYPEKDFHHMFFGEITAIYGERDKYSLHA